MTILGAHSLGGARAENSGYKGKWTGAINAGFSELFYTNMISKGIKWTNVVSIYIFNPGNTNRRGEGSVQLTSSLG